MTAADGIVYIAVPPKHIVDVTWAFEGYEHLALVTTIDNSQGIVKLIATPDTVPDVLQILQNMSFSVIILERFIENTD